MDELMTQCHNWILVMHKAHCERFISLCEKCQEPVPIKDMNLHNEERHAVQPCSNCKLPVATHEAAKHLVDNCPKRLIPCQYCELDCLASDLEDHMVACGSRTDQCVKCSKRVLIRMMNQHVNSHRITQEMTQNLGARSPQTLRPRASSWEEPRELESANSSSHDNPMQEQAWARSNDDEDAYWARYKPQAQEDSTSTESISIPCEICSIPFPIDCIELHEMSCQFSNDDLPSTSVASDDDWVGAGTATMQNPVAEIQCQHCDLTVPKNLLDLHEVGCAKDIAHRRSLHSRISNKQSVRPKPVNNRVEKPVQRDMRQNVLKAAENRTTTNPQIRQSAYNVVTLGDGTQVLKKRNVDVQSGHTGHILGRAKQLPTGRNTSVGPSDLSLSRPVRR